MWETAIGILGVGSSLVASIVSALLTYRSIRLKAMKNDSEKEHLIITITLPSGEQKEITVESSLEKVEATIEKLAANKPEAELDTTIGKVAANKIEQDKANTD